MRTFRRPSWRLNSHHRLVTYSESGSIQTLSSELIAADDSSLSFEISSRDTGGNDHLRVLKLTGNWQVDKQNRLTFLVNDNREDGCLVFRNGWQVGRDRQIVYTYENSASGRSGSFSLEGVWCLDSAERIAYRLGKGRRTLSFRCQMESLSLYPAKGKIKFRVGCGIKGDRPNDVYIFGAWKLGRRFSFDFEAGSQGRIRLESRVNFLDRNTISLILLSKNGRPLGVTVEVARRLIPGADAAAFLRLKGCGSEKSIEAGITLPF
jgi:hypothetical protein